MIPAVAGGIIYSVGAIVDINGWPTVIPFIFGPHETFHFAVLGGLSCHWHVISKMLAESQFDLSGSIMPIVNIDSAAVSAISENAA